MNDYRITYTSQSGEESNAYVTERTEASARKFFNSTHKGMGFTIQNVELHRENTCATKQQERDTLAAIRKMVEELGPQSYLATAFQGCFEDAEQNIENDFGDSMKGRAESAERKAESLESQVKELQEKLRQEIAERQRARDEAQEFIKKLEAMVLSPDDLEDLRQLASDRATEADELAGKAAAEIVKYADDPTGKEFQNAVKQHRDHARTAEYCRNLLGRVAAVQAAAHAQGRKEAI